MLTKADLILAVVLLILGLGSPFLLQTKKSEGTRIVLVMDGEEIGDYSLSEDRVIAVTKSGAKDLGKNIHILPEKEKINEEVLNLVVIENGTVRVSEATCKGRDCIKMGSISREGQVIACLPHKLLISVYGGEDSPDAVIK